MNKRFAMICRLFLLLCMSFTAAGTSMPVSVVSQGELILPLLWVPNNTVLAMVTSGDTLYIGGSFTQVGPPIGNFAVVQAVDGQADLTFPPVGGGTVRAILPDGHGGWFIGGDFRTVNGQPRSGLAHIRPDHSLNPSWNPGANFTIYALALGANRLYVGGTFTTIAGQSRPYLAALDSTTGNLVDWDPQCTNSVYALALDGSVLYTGGAFGFIGGVSRSRAAALDTTKNTNMVTEWNPNASGTGAIIYSLALNTTNVYLGGTFSSISGTSRPFLAAVDKVNGSLNDWAPAPSAQVDTLLLSGTTLYAGGRFTTIGGQSRRHLAALDTQTNTNNALSWNPNPNSGGWVNSLALQGNTLYAVGRFTSMGGQPRRYLTAIDTTTGNATAWNPDPNNILYSIAAAGDVVAAGGVMTSINGVTRNGIAALDLTTGELTDWNPNAMSNSSPGTVYALVTDGPMVYAGGFFTNIGGQPRNYLAALDTSLDSASATDWTPSPNGSVRALALSGTTLYAGGSFTSIGGQSRGRIAALDTTMNSNNATNWNPNFTNGTVYTILLSDTTMYTGGSFGQVGGQSRGYTAALDITTTSDMVLPWNPRVDDNVYALARIGNTIYLGGDFWTVGDSSREYLAGVDATTGEVTAFNPILQYSSDNSVYALAASGNVLFVGGGYYYVNDVEQSYLAAFEPQVYGSQPLSWSPWLTGTVYSLLAQDNHLYMGGDFSSVNMDAQASVACVSKVIPLISSHVYLPLVTR